MKRNPHTVRPKFATHLVSEKFRLIYYIICYVVYIIGYTLQTACTKAGQSCLTNDPEQRPAYTFWDTLYTCALYAIFPIMASGPIYNYGGGFTAKYFLALSVFTILCSAFLTILAVIGIWEHDRHEYFGGEEKTPKYSFRDYLDVLKGNRALQMLIVSAASDSLASGIKGSSVLMVVLFGIMFGNYSIYGTVSGIVIFPAIIIALFGTRLAAKQGMKKALRNFSAINILCCVFMTFILTLAYTTGHVGGNSQIYMYIFLVFYFILYCFETMSSEITIPMIADVIDYEQVTSGKYIPGMMGTLFSFVNKLVSSLCTTVVSLGLVIIGYSDVQPQAEDAMTRPLFIFLIVMYIVVPVIGWLCNLVALRFYPLSKEKMEEIQLDLQKKENKLLH